MHIFRQGCLLLFLLWLLPACEFRQNGAGPEETTAVSITTTPPIPPSATQTPPPALPTAPATAVPQPTPTYNPALADWTVLVYMAADNNLQNQALRDLQEMAVAGSSTAVHVIVQLDLPDSGAARYALPSLSPIVALGAQAMGSAQTLSDFLVWGRQNYPANRTALIIWNHGAGWQGTAFDEGDSLNLPELQAALRNALAQTGQPPLDLLAFDACLMGQLEVFQAVHPFARYAVGSAELTPGEGWQYQALLAELYAAPEQEGAALAQRLVANFRAAYADDDFVTMTAVDLSRLPDLTFASETLAAALMADPDFVAAAVSEGRSGATQFARAYAPETSAGSGAYATTDLGQFAAILAQRSPDPLVQESARRVLSALESTLLAHYTGAGMRHSRGLAIYFPRTAAQYDATYGRVTPLPQWNRFLLSHYNAAQPTAVPPQLNLSSLPRETAGEQNPAYLEFEIVGRNIDQVILIGGLYEENGQRRLLEYDRLIPEPTYLPDGSQIYVWRDGLHEDFFVWDTKVTYMYDSFGHGGFVVMWPTAPGSTLFSVQGQYRPTEDAAWTVASLLFDHQTGQMARLWSQNASGAAELIPVPGGEFQLFDYYLAPDNAITQQEGGSLYFDEAGLLYFDWRPLPDGRYYLGFAAENSAGQRTYALTDLNVQNSGNLPGYAAYLDPYLGFQFLYPADWYTPVYTRGVLYTSDQAAQTFLQVKVYPEAGRGATANALQAEALRQFGRVDVLFVDEVRVAGLRGLRTAYGYERADGALRTGLLLTFTQGGVGYVVDVDGAQELEAETITAVSSLITSWQFTGAAFGAQPGQWQRRTLPTFAIAQPTDFIYQPTNTWQRFSADRETFVALRVRPATETMAEILTRLVQDAGNGVTNFRADEPRRFALGSTPWQRVDFSYTNGSGQEIWGFIMVRLEAGQEVVAWAEAPKRSYNELETSVFLVMIADLQRN